jgi:hypothetical protein
VTDRPPPPGIDTSVAHVARVYDYMLGGTTNYDVDRRAAELAAAPVGGMEAIRFATRSNRAFLGRAVRYLATEAGVQQFLDVGTGLPTEQNVHQVAQRHQPTARIVYVDNDPTVLSHARVLLESNPEGATSYINGDLRDPQNILLRAEATLDFAEPVGVLLFTILHTIRDDEDPWTIVAGLLDAVPPGSYLAMSHLTGDLSPRQMADSKEVLDEEMHEPFILRTHADISRFFEDTDLVDPGLVPINDWKPDDAMPAAPADITMPPPIYGAVARKT